MSLKNQEQINKDLSEKDTDKSEFQKKVLEYVKPLLKASSDRMCEYHDQWDTYDWIYRGYRVKDREDKEAAQKGEPSKIIIPVTYAQVQTAISFLMATFLQRNDFYELRGMGPEDEKSTFPMQTDLSYQLGKNQWPLKLYCWWLDALKYGFGVVKSDWTEESCRMRVGRKQKVSSPFGFFGRLFEQKKEEQYEYIEEIADVLQYQGNRIRNVSPYAFYPDPDLPIAKFQEGAFVCHEEERSRSGLRKLEGSDFFGTDLISDSIPTETYSSRKRRAGGSFGKKDGIEKFLSVGDSDNDGCIFSEVEITMTASRVNAKFGTKLPESDYEEKWIISIANDDKIIGFKAAGYLHAEYNYDLIEFSPDSNAFYNPGLSETINELQGLITFFINSHVVNVKKIIKNRLLVNPEMVKMEDILSNSDFIRTMGAVPGDLDRVLKQLQVSDVTKGHVGDVASLSQLLQQVTGINENALGQYASGRRSATEARNVNAGAAARLKMLGTLGWVQGIEPLGRKLLANTRQGRTEEVYNQIVGNAALQSPFAQVILADPNKIAGGYDFIPYDATLPSDRQSQAGILTELFSVLVSNPNTIQILQKNPMPLLEYIAQLHGIKNLKDFDLNPQQPLVMPAPQVVPDEEAQAAAAGGATPVQPFATELAAQLAG